MRREELHIKAKREKRYSWAVNGCLALMTAMLYLLMNTDALALTAMAEPNDSGGEQGLAAVEFVVSWNAAAMGDILDILKEKDTRVTFMVSGEWVRQNESLARNIVNDGHEIGTLGDNVDLALTGEELLYDITKSIERIKRCTGADVHLYYSVKGDAECAHSAAEKLSLTHFYETVDLRCASGSAQDIITRGLNEPILGGIILLQPTRECAAALGDLIDALNARGITAARVSDVL